MTWTAEQQRAKRAEDAAKEGKTVRSYKRRAGSDSAPSSSACASSSSDAIRPEPPPPSSVEGSIDGIGITDEEVSVIRHIRQINAENAAKDAAARENASGQYRLLTALAPSHATSVADVRSSMLRRLQHANAHWQECKNFERSMHPSLAVYQRVSQHCHQHGRLPPWAPYDELQQPYNQPSFPHVLPYVCDKCVTGFIEEADSFLPCDRCMHFEQMVCDAGSAFPSVSLPGYLLDRVNLSEHEQ